MSENKRALLPAIERQHNIGPGTEGRRRYLQ